MCISASYTIIIKKNHLYIEGCPFLNWVTCQQVLSLLQSSAAKNEHKLDYAVMNSKILPPASCCGAWTVSLL